ncbi:hypothetical protein CEQ21_10730 [Niallia circulans]|uniref:Uncharacterized protein n=1 Tax=Niallia circulans TaxID=1397 RepID=A0A553SGF2_NIACI|nr:hypothetical protein [Niallia circulans]TRZ36064.1 hypothetical protein CEQ21_10730 [Niallia circulans]
MKTMRTLAVVGAGVGSYLLFTSKGKEMMQRVTQMLHSKKDESTIMKAGNPDPQDIDDNNMVSEGAMYSVNYYNKQRPE